MEAKLILGKYQPANKIPSNSLTERPPSRKDIIIDLGYSYFIGEKPAEISRILIKAVRALELLGIANHYRKRLNSCRQFERTEGMSEN